MAIVKVHNPNTKANSKAKGIVGKLRLSPKHYRNIYRGDDVAAIYRNYHTNLAMKVSE